MLLVRTVQLGSISNAAILLSLVLSFIPRSASVVKLSDAMSFNILEP